MSVALAPTRRLFFGCTHVTLRATEVPIWIAAGLEVVPEEVDTGVLNRLEAEHYDDPHRHPVVAQCQESSTLEAEVRNTVRRARLRQRRGKLSPGEVELFNACFDIVYVATDLETAVNVKRWFQGEVIYRYFGHYDNLLLIRDMAQSFDREALRDIVCLPILSTLEELGLRELFERVATMHGYVRQEETSPRWAGYRENQPAVVVQSAVREGAPQTSTLRRMAPLATRVPLVLLGKNDLTQVPADIAAAFAVPGTLARQEYLARFFDGRLLIHPFANRYHNQYTNVEAVTAGMPVLFLADNPLYLEQTSPELNAHPPEWFGAFSSETELFQAAEDYFDRPQQLAELAARQQRLLEPYCWDNVLAEAKEALGLLRSRLRDQSPTLSETTPHSLAPCAAIFEAQRTFFQFSESVPAYAFALESDWQLLALDLEQRPVLRIPVSAGARQIIVGSNPSIPAGTYDLELQGHSLEGAVAIAVVEVYAQKNLVSVLRFVPTPEPDGRFAIKARLEAAESCTLSLYLQACVSGAVELASLALIRRSEQATKVNLSSNDDGWEKLIVGQWTEIACLANSRDLSVVRHAATSALGLSLSADSAPRQLIFGQTGQRLDPQGYAFELWIEAHRRGQATLTLETWSESDIVASITVRVSLAPGKTIVPVAGKPARGCSWITPVLYIQADPETEGFLVAVRLKAGRRHIA